MKPGVYPFWFWNGAQEENHITEQLEAMKAGGCRGVVLHSRTGNKTPYLSARWFELFAHACECAKRLGLTVWLYDEDGYPSGNAGGRVQKERPDLRQKNLTFAYEPTNPDAPCFAAFDATTYNQIDEKAVPRGTPALRFTQRFFDRHVDMFSREAADLFISITHEKYAEHIGQYFRDPIELVYTDDESFQVCTTWGIPWSEVLDSEYARRFGHQLATILPRLVEDLPGSSEARLRFYSLARELFLENFIRPQVEWCNRHGLAYAGHLCGDEGPSSTAISRFGTAIPYLMAEDIPSIDDYLCEIKDHAYLRVPLNTADHRFVCKDKRVFCPLQLYKGASSVANQFKDGFVSAENITFLGWEIQPAFLETQMMFELAMGVNLITPHAYYYTIGDGTKYDCPPSYFTHQPFYEIFGKRCDSWTRIAELLMRGSYHADCLVIFPDRIVESQTGNDINRNFELRSQRERMHVDEFDLHFNMLLMELARRHVGHEMGEDSIVAENAKLHDEAISLGKRKYKTVVCLSGVAITSGTARLLEKFKASGGRVLTLPPGEYDALDTLEADIPLSGEGCEEILVHARNNNGSREAFLLNLSGRTLSPKLAMEGDFLVYNPIEEVAFKASGSLPSDFVLERGAYCMIMPANFECRIVPYETTAYKAKREWSALSPSSIKPLRPNIAAFPKTKGFAFEVEEGAHIAAIYTEHVGKSGLTVNGTTPDKSLPHHPCDFCFEGVDVSALCHTGSNTVALDAVRDMVYLEGDFMLDGAILRAPRELGLGDLAQARMPHYWGGVEYVFEFDGVHDLLRVDLTGGAAEIFINASSAGVIFGEPATLRIRDFCSDGHNKLSVRVYSTAANFVTGHPAPFGLLAAEIS